MKILITIAHFFKPEDNSRHDSRRKDPQPRLAALSQSLAALHQLFSKSQSIINIKEKLAFPANQPLANDLDIVICTTQDCHLLDRLTVPTHFYQHYPTEAKPMFLGFECQGVLRDSLGKYDYYCFLEDDLIIHDPWFFVKLYWFNKEAGDRCLLQPNRYEISTHGLSYKAYIDGDINPKATEKFQNLSDRPQLQSKIMGVPMVFRRALNPHSGCYFLNANQMKLWASKPDFLDRDSSFIGSLESAATLGIMKHFLVYKTIPQQASFLEIQHYGTKFLDTIGQQIDLSM
ncbi:calcium-binding protein [Aerosakkonemataceae cyanobacterium BLCC-F154]|uniref:Calcium-binding protein n=1 Tax=Floridaenema fluviatile BLCC-F154 TaxID=3153640 RepID=A0ABV4YKU7_9CYAN